MTWCVITPRVCRIVVERFRAWLSHVAPLLLEATVTPYLPFVSNSLLSAAWAIPRCAGSAPARWAADRSQSLPAS